MLISSSNFNLITYFLFINFKVNTYTVVIYTMSQWEGHVLSIFNMNIMIEEVVI